MSRLIGHAEALSHVIQTRLAMSQCRKSTRFGKLNQPAHAGRSPCESLATPCSRHYAREMRWWFLTWTTYGTWLPGDRRGSVSARWNERDTTRNNRHGEAYDGPSTQRHREAAMNQRHGSVWLRREHAERLLTQFRETAAYRRWTLIAVAIMANHVHLLVEATGDPEPDRLLRDFKSYGSRALNAAFGPRDRWWTQSGSKRKRNDEAAVVATVRYVRDQARPLVVWLNEESRFVADLEGDGEHNGERPA